MREKICRDPRWKSREKIRDRFYSTVINRVTRETTGRDFDTINFIIKHDLYWILYETTRQR